MEYTESVYEYMEIHSSHRHIHEYTTCYTCFGWEITGSERIPEKPGYEIIHFCRDRRVINRTELIRLQKHFETCVSEIQTLQHSTQAQACIWALTIGMAGMVCLIGVVYAWIHHLFIGIVLVVPALFGFFQPYSVYQKAVKLKRQVYTPVIERKKREIQEICDKGRALI